MFINYLAQRGYKWR